MLLNRGCTILVAGSVPGFGKECLRLWAPEGTITDTKPILIVGYLSHCNWSKYTYLTSVEREYESVCVITTDSAREPTIPDESFDQISCVPNEIHAFQDAICQIITRIRYDHVDNITPKLHVFIDSL